MTRQRVSVVVASRDRAASLRLCLTGLAQVQYHPFEIVVVADRAGRDAASRHPLAPRLRIVECDDSNLSHARNLGVAAAAGDVVAFIDDDAVAEPDWLAQLAEPFADATIDAAGGYVLGRNGISFQWRARMVDSEGWSRDLPIAASAPVAPEPPDSGAVRTEGTNMAVRRSALAAMGGFDERFRYYLEDTDLNLRLAKANRRVAIVPGARVWHHQAASPRRRDDRTPRSLYEIGASLAAFLETHAEGARSGTALLAHRDAERRRLLRHMVAGRLEPGDVARLLEDFDRGVSDGASRPPRPSPDFLSPDGFRPISSTPTDAPRRVLSGWLWQRRSILDTAHTLCAEGALVHLIVLTPSALYHRRRYVAPGIWLQTGGLYGRSNRGGRLVQRCRMAERVHREASSGPLSQAVSLDIAT